MFDAANTSVRKEFFEISKRIPFTKARHLFFIHEQIQIQIRSGHVHLVSTCFCSFFVSATVDDEFKGKRKID